ncbi:MAG: ion transporter [Salibacteraceae bacterium]
MSYRKTKKRVFEILEKGQSGDSWSRRVDILIIGLIFLNILAVILESVEWIETAYYDWFYVLEMVSIGIFSIEYLLRLWSITEKKGFHHPILGRIKYIFSFLSLVDLLAVLPAYLPLLLTVDTRIFRAIRVLRLFRILKLYRYNRAFNHIAAVFRSTREELVISLSAVLTLLVVASCLMYFIEHDVQPDAFGSIPETMWWGVATLTTVGYGDVYPITPLGKISAGVMAILGVGLFALPAGILANGFSKRIESDTDEEETVVCEHCGKPIKNS